jgi:hypothetical protein
MTDASGLKPSPRLARVDLRPGTRYFLVVHGRLSGPFVLDHGVEVKVGDLGQRPGEFNTYERDGGVTILVRVQDELRGWRP